VHTCGCSGCFFVIASHTHQIRTTSISMLYGGLQNEGATLNKARGHINISRLPSLRAHAWKHVLAIDRIV
jgi:hypothetical protein